MKQLACAILIAVLAGCTRSDDREISASGTIEATEVNISAKVGGRIDRLPVDEGTAVRAGDTLAVIDRSDLAIQLRQAMANAAAADAQFRLTARGARQEDIVQAEASFKNAEDDLKRAEELFKANSATQKQLDDARTRFIVSRSVYEKLKHGPLPEEIDAARARREQAAAQVDAVRKQIADAVVLAPSNGEITQRSVEVGEIVLPNAALFRLSRLETVHLMIYVSEIELARVKSGQSAKVFIDAAPGKPLPGRVTYISPIAEFTPKNVQTKEDRTKLVFGVKIEAANQLRLLKPGMPADATIVTDTSSVR
ncbi:MAG: hypothetical protein COS95_08105 [Ignavibacteriales bacterium CG07_land_8_20_14_0_80_59_12]|nr:MAG: hypothetical protein COS95_08105 [Ignavibacteriales bacterium CG07_land_8_20_14_0_80_59_12]